MNDLQDQARPFGKTYACHDCEVQAIGKAKQKSSFEFTTIKNGNCRIEFNLTGSRFNLDECYHKCVHCDAFFAQSSTLSRHIRERHNFLKNEDNNSVKMLNPRTSSGMESLKFTCTLCGLSFPRGSILARHLKDEHKPADAADAADKKKNLKLKVKTRTSTLENLNLTRDLGENHKKVAKFICKLCRKEFTLQRSDDNQQDAKMCKKCENQRSKKKNLHGRRRSKRIRLRNSWFWKKWNNRDFNKNYSIHIYCSSFSSVSMISNTFYFW